MSQIDVEHLLSPIDSESPSGPNMAYDPDYLEVERLSEGTPEHQMGDSVIAAEEPDWGDIERRCAGLLGQTRDLQLIILFLVANIERHGLDGLAAGLTLLRGAVDSFWDTIHPQLDPDDDLDPTERLNIIAALAAPPGLSGDIVKFIARVRAIPLSESRAFGRVSLRDIALATGEAQPSGDEVAPDIASIAAAFEDTDLDVLVAHGETAATAKEEAVRIDASLTNLVGAGQAPDLSEFLKAVAELDRILGEHISRRSPVAEDVAVDGEEVAVEQGAGGGATQRISGEITSRDDVTRVLDRICEYYKLHEPSSPVPILLKRARSIVSKDFVDILRELTEMELAEFKIRLEDERLEDVD